MLRWVLFLLIVGGVVAEPHPHFGVVKPFSSGDPGVKLTKQALSVLKSGKPYKTQIQDGTAGRGLVVQDVKAPVATVWGRILDFDSYNKMVPKTIESKTYKIETLKRGKKHIWVRMKVGFPVLKLQFYINHLYDPHNNSLTWTLDYTIKSDLDDSAGYWYVIPHPDKPNEWTRVYYSVEVSMFPWIPHFVVDFMSKQALTDATAWVKKYSEQEAQKTHQESTAPVEVIARSGLPKRAQQLFLGPFSNLGRRGGDEDDNNKSDNRVENTAQEVGNAKKIGITRYALVVTVVTLVLYNIHLYFSQ